MEENRNPFGSRQPGSHQSPAPQPEQNAGGAEQGANGGAPYGNTGAPPYQNDPYAQNGYVQDTGWYGQQASPNGCGQYPYGGGPQEIWQDFYGGPFPEQNGMGFSGEPVPWPPAEPDRKMNAGVKVFLIILSVLAVGFVGGFIGFGIYVAVGQQSAAAPDTSTPDSAFQDSDGRTEQDDTAYVPDKTDPAFEGIAFSGTDGAVLTPEQVYEKASVSMVSVLASHGDGSSQSASVSQGSGVIATSNGYIITNAHVLRYSRTAQVSVLTHDQKQYDGVVVGLDRDADLAVVKIEAENLTPAEFGDDKDLSVGETVAAIGNPGGVRYSGSMTLGVVSAVNRSVEEYSSTGITYIQTDTAINPGNSGGGLINMRGQVVGINTIKVVSSGYEGVGFSIPISQAKSILDALIREGSIPSVGRLGITGSTRYLPVEGEVYSEAGGVLVVSVDSGSPLADSMLRQGDLIVAFNGAAVKTLEDIYAQLKDHRVGEEVTLTVRRMDAAEDMTFDVQTVIMARE